MFILFKQTNDCGFDDLTYPVILGAYPTFNKMVDALMEDLSNEREKRCPNNPDVEETLDLSSKKGVVNATRYIGDYIFQDDGYGVRWFGIRIDENFNKKTDLERTLFILD